MTSSLQRFTANLQEIIPLSGIQTILVHDSEEQIYQSTQWSFEGKWLNFPTGNVDLGRVYTFSVLPTTLILYLQ